MAQLEVYIDFKEKKEHFNTLNGFICNDVKILFSKLEDLKHENKFLFRGVNSAKYKLYNSAQRLFNLREIFALNSYGNIQSLYNNWINNLLIETKSWNRSSLSNYFNSIGITNDSVLAYLSFMQHSSIPTPLLDFTHDPFISLFFATQNIVNDNCNIDLDSCISLYYIDKTTKLSSILSVDSILNTTTETPENNYLDFVPKHSISIIEHDSINYCVKNSYNIINQKGCFIFNGDAINPFENVYNKNIKSLNENIPKLIGKHDPINDKIFCIDIHKSLIPKILYELDKQKNINNEFVYPIISLSKDEIINNSIIQLTR